MSELHMQAERARNAALLLADTGSRQRDEALLSMAQCVESEMHAILAANALDIENARAKGMTAAFIERLTLNEPRVVQMAQGLRDLTRLPDPLGTVDSGWVRPNGLEIARVRVPLGVVGIIFESRPNVTSDAAGLCIKSGNAVILRGGSDAIHSNRAIMCALQAGAADARLPDGCVSLVQDTSREAADELMRLNGLIDVLIPRGGKGLIHSVVENARVPVIQTGDGVCHVYVHSAADFHMACNIIENAKCSHPSVCNAAETLLVDAEIASQFLPAALQLLHSRGVELRGDEATCALCPDCIPATAADWDTEYNDMILSIKIVDDIDAAISHINTHGTRHSEAIVTRDLYAAHRFQARVDAAAVYVNASTRFTDGAEFGFGAEIGISNQKLHARGPMGLAELTTYKYLIDGDGQVR